MRRINKTHLILLMLLLFSEIVRADIIQPNVAFWAPTIEYSPGELLLLRPRLPAVNMKNVKNYELRIELPAGLKEKKMDLEKLDAKIGFFGRSKKFMYQIHGSRQTFVIRPETEIYWGMKVVPGATYTLSCWAKGKGIVGKGFEISGYFRDQRMNPIVSYPTYIGFDEGTYDWKLFKTQLKAPKNATYLILTAIKWKNQGTYGTLYIDDLSLNSDKEPGKNLMLAGDLENTDNIRAWPYVKPLEPVLAPKTGSSNNLAICLSGTKAQTALQSSYWLPLPIEPVKANFENPHELSTMVFDVPLDFKGNHFIKWSIVTDDDVVSQGKVSLVPAPKTSGPKRIKFSIWLTESNFEYMPHNVQEMYLQRFKRLGLNGIMPSISEPYYNVPIDGVDFANWTALRGRYHGMVVNSALRFLYGKAAKPYCEQYPEYWATTWVGKKTSDYRVCLTHALDGDKYDEKKTGVRGGKDNPWLGRLYETVLRSVKVNDLQGVWWDFEIAGVPIRKERPIPYNSDRHRQVCTDLRCRRAFADFVKLDQVPTVKEIMSNKYYELWNDFKCWQHIRLWSLMKEAAQRSNPYAKFGLYSGAPSAYSRQAYGVDWTMAAKVIDVAMSQHLVQNDESLAKAHFDASQKGDCHNPLIMSIQINGYNMSDHIRAWQSRRMLENQILQMVIDWDASGVALTGVWGFDSQFNVPVRTTSAVFSKYEDVLINGKHDDKQLSVKPKGTQYAAWLSSDSNRIVGFFFNNMNTSMKIRIAKTRSWSRISTITTSLKQADDSVSFSIPAWSHVIIEFVK